MLLTSELYGGKPRVLCTVSRSIKRTTNGIYKRKALLIAQSYRHDATRSLPGCDKEASRMQAALRRTGWDDTCFCVLVNEDATSKNIREELCKLVSQTHNLDECLVYVAGHGAGRPDTTGMEIDGQQECIVCHDGDLISDVEIEQITSACASSCSLVLIVDCCHSGTVSNGTPFRSAMISDGCHHRVTLSACRDDQSAIQDARGRGELTKRVVRTLARDGNIPLTEMNGYRLGGSQNAQVTVNGDACRASLFLD